LGEFSARTLEGAGRLASNPLQALGAAVDASTEGRACQAALRRVPECLGVGVQVRMRQVGIATPKSTRRAFERSSRQDTLEALTSQGARAARDETRGRSTAELSSTIGEGIGLCGIR